MFYKIEKTGTCMGYEYLIKFLDGGYRCGYVKVPENMELPENLDVHGGITFDKTDEGETYNLPEGRWIGFDCMHRGDINSPEDAEKLLGIKTTPVPSYATTGHYWTLEEVEAECRYLCKQLAERKENQE